MGIRFLCPSCRNKVHVKDRLAGLRGFCPTCGAKVDIPFQSTLPGKSGSTGDADSDHETNGAAPAQYNPAQHNAAPAQYAAAPASSSPYGAQSAALDSAAHNEISVSAILPRVGRLVAVHMNPPADPLVGATGAVWYVVPPEGTEPFGPADSATMNSWLQQGRIVSRSLVWRQDWPEWRKAGMVWSQLALSDVDPRLQRNADRVRGTSAQTAAPQFASPRVPTSSPGQGSLKPGSLMAQMHSAAAAQPARAASAMPGGAMPGTMSASPMTAASVPQRGPLTAVPASHSPPPPGSGPPPDGLYYPQRSHKVYWAIVGVLLLGLVGMSVALFYVLDQMKQHKQPTQPTETVTTPEVTSDDKSNDDTPSGGSSKNDSSGSKKPNGTRPKRTTNP